MKKPELTPDQRRRYSRTIMLEGMGREAQQRLLDASVFIVGAGALGSVVAMYLASSGVGHITVADFDTIDISNLQRQLSYVTTDIGKPKVRVLAERIAAINPDVSVNIHEGMLTRKLINDALTGHDFVIEGSDNPATKYMVAEACENLGLPYCLGGVSQYLGQVMTHVPGTASYADIFPEAADEGGYTPCSIGGVLGPLPGVIGSIQACEAVKYIAGTGQLLTDALLTVDALTMRFSRYDL